MNDSLKRKHPKAIYEGRWIFIILGALWLLSLIFLPLLSLPVAILIIFSAYFFRDPERNVPSSENLIVSPADGTVSGVDEVDGVEGDAYLTGRMKRISIFLSIFDVHVNRAPIAGEILHSEPRGGIYLDARKPESSLLNESRLWIIKGDQLTVGVKQITGAIARRIVPWSRVGDRVQRGERFGMIRFGSRTELYLPMDAEILVKKGDKVLGATTPVAEWKQEK